MSADVDTLDVERKVHLAEYMHCTKLIAERRKAYCAAVRAWARAIESLCRLEERHEAQMTKKSRRDVASARYLSEERARSITAAREALNNAITMRQESMEPPAQLAIGDDL